MQGKLTDNSDDAEIKRHPLPNKYWCCDYKGGCYTFEESLEMARAFHGYPAPGLILGLRMVTLAMERLPENILFDALTETPSCLPDAVQILTVCTAGNNWLKVMDLGRFALALFDKQTGMGVRVAVDPLGLERWPELFAWLYRKKSRHQQDSEALYRDIQSAAERVLMHECITVHPRHLKKKNKGSIGTCPVCGEAFPLNHGNTCRVCQGETPYRSQDILRMKKLD